MKKLLMLLSWVICANIVFAQSPVSFVTTTHDFGKVKQGKPVTFEFVFKNNSAKPVVVELATAECGCTTPEYPKAPVMKGKTAIIKVTYNAADAGAFTKTVTVKFANVEQPIVLTIEGEVIAQKK